MHVAACCSGSPWVDFGHVTAVWVVFQRLRGPPIPPASASNLGSARCCTSNVIKSAWLLAVVVTGDMRPPPQTQPNPIQPFQSCQLVSAASQTVVVLFPRMMAYPLSPTIIIGVAVPLDLRQSRPLNPVPRLRLLKGVLRTFRQ